MFIGLLVLNMQLFLEELGRPRRSCAGPCSPDRAAMFDGSNSPVSTAELRPDMTPLLDYGENVRRLKPAGRLCISSHQREIGVSWSRAGEFNLGYRNVLLNVGRNHQHRSDRVFLIRPSVKYRSARLVTSGTFLLTGSLIIRIMHVSARGRHPMSIICYSNPLAMTYPMHARDHGNRQTEAS